MAQKHEQRPKLRIPCQKYGTSADTVHYTIHTLADKLTADYAGVSVFDVPELDYVDYLILRHDAIIYKHMQTESGREYLQKCWEQEQTDIDATALAAFFGGAKNGG